ncbi:MAG: helix-turn-helix transcriptional regulator [Oleispira sp.]|nr:helix-turn-helix transcriptional regulator [Oleispira sp.]
MNAHLPNGDNLRAMRLAAGMKMKEARTRANEIAKRLDPEIHFSDRSMRRFERIGIDEIYGKTPPSYAELNILMRTYNGSPNYLILNIKPVLIPIERTEKHAKSFFNDDMMQLMSEIGGWSLSRQHQFFEFYKNFIKR